METPQDIKPDFAEARTPWVQNALSAFKFIGAVILLVLIINGFGLQSYEVFGQSMEPTLSPGDRLVISKLGKTFSSISQGEFVPKRGDIIVFNDPRGSSDLQLIKRVIGLPGERVKLEDGVITIYNDEFPDGFNVDAELKLDLEYTSGLVDITVENDHVFVSGDNRSPGGSLDSRNELGTVSIDKIIGTLEIRLFPLGNARLF
ncbi:TPA: signal peptidase I [Candidatus Saccharibacteria bacterium]|nr:signal peptidase I [Candidatus Saccharibacteria bacterium]HIO87211.1 signal peptidase I [Candidatus Saccharibacteria bacterium]